MKKILSIALLIEIIDQTIKAIITKYIPLGTSVSIIDNFFSLTTLKNTGAAFSILSSNTSLLIIISLIALILIYNFFIKNKQLTNKQKIIYGILIGGILGNLTDRIIHNFVIDYLDLNILGYNFPVFNLADICIVISISLIIILNSKGEKNEVSSK